MLLTPDALAASEASKDKSHVQAAKRAPERKQTKPITGLSSDMIRALNLSVREGKLGLLASVFDSVHRHPSQRDAVLDHVRGLAPGLTRDLITAADLGVLTAGQTLRLASNADAILNERRAAASPRSAAMFVSTASASAASPRALPIPAPSAADQTWHLGAIGADAAYRLGFTGQGVTVAIGDTGFDVYHDALSNKFDLSRAQNYIINTWSTPYIRDYVDIQSPTDMHGSHVAGIIGASKLAGVDMHGVAYNAMLVPIRVIVDSDEAPDATYAPDISDPMGSALAYFRSLADVKVYNASYGPTAPNSPPQAVWLFDSAEAQEAAAAIPVLAADKIIVAAAGNDRDRHPVAGRNPSGLALVPFIQPAHAHTGVYDDYGANYDFSAMLRQPGQIISVMSVGYDLAPAAYSNLCGVTASWCVAAPGGNRPHDTGIYSTSPDNTYVFEHGTSMAAPVVSGALAVLIEANPGYSARDLARLLFSTTEDLGAPGVDDVFGYGLIRLDRATDGPVGLARDSTVTVTGGQTMYWSRPLTTSGAFTKDGDGVLTIAGRTTASGNVQVSLGTLAVDGTLTVSAGQALTVSQASTLAGIGEIAGNAVISGTLSPGKMPNVADLITHGVIFPGETLDGNSAGLLTFNGNVMLTGTATTRIDIDGDLLVPGGPGTYDRIVVSGAGHTFTADGTLTPILRDSVGTVNDFTPAIGANFKFISAEDGARVAGSFASLVQPTSGLPANGRFDLIYAPTAVTLAVTPSTFSGMSEGGLNPNQQGVANILDSSRPAAGVMPSAFAKPLYDGLYSLPDAMAYGQALTQLSSPGQPAAGEAAINGIGGFMGSIADRQAALLTRAADAQSGIAQVIGFAYTNGMLSAEARQAAAAFASLNQALPTEDDWAIWGQGFGRWSTVGDSGALAGSKSRSGGFSVGADRVFGPDLIGGIAFGFARTATDSAGSRVASDSYSGALYASWTPGRAIVDARIAAGPAYMHTTRDIMLTPRAIEGRADGIGASVALEAGYRIGLGQYTLKPFAGVTWQGLRRNAYAETQQPFGLTFPTQSFEKLGTTLGAAVNTRHRTDMGVTLMPEVRLAWGHDLRDTALVSQAALLDSAFTITAANPGRDSALFGFKLSGWTRENFRLFGSYNGEFRRNAVSHQVTGGARYTW
jgi:outer membrane autotransporter protein